LITNASKIEPIEQRNERSSLERLNTNTYTHTHIYIYIYIYIYINRLETSACKEQSRDTGSGGGLVKFGNEICSTLHERGLSRDHVRTFNPLSHFRGCGRMRVRLPGSPFSFCLIFPAPPPPPFPFLPFFLFTPSPAFPLFFFYPRTRPRMRIAPPPYPTLPR